MDLGKEIKDIFYYVVIGLVLAFVFNLTIGFALGSEKPVMAVVSSSMEPTFHKGDLVIIKGVPAEEIQVGDVIVYTNPIKNIPVVHRVIDIQKAEGNLYFFTRGDNNATNRYMDQTVKGNLGLSTETILNRYLNGDISPLKFFISPPVSEDQVRGKVILVIPYLGMIKVLFTELISKYGLIKVIFALLLFFLIIGVVEDFVREKKRGKSS